jgi:hypothetical protein
MSAVLREKPAAERLRDVQKELAAAGAEADRWRREAERLDAEAARHRKVVDAVAPSRAALADLHERRASGEAIADRQNAQAETDLAEAERLADRASLARQGAEASGRKSSERADASLARAGGLRAEADRLRAEILREAALASRERYRAQCEVLAAQFAEHAATVAACLALSAALDLAPPERGGDVLAPGVPTIELPTSPLVFPFWESRTEEERHERHGSWTFRVGDRVRQRSEELARELRERIAP